MLKPTAVTMILTGALLVQASRLFAQQQATPTISDQDIQLLRQDVRSEKKQLILANMQLTEAEAPRFWPVYDAYTQENIKVNDARYALIKEYAQSYDTMTDAQAKSLISRWESTDEQLVTQRIKWMPKFEAVLPGKKAALFFQLDRRISLLIDLQLASMIPIVKP
jgi:hypothetical protein